MPQTRMQWQIPILLLSLQIILSDGWVVRLPIPQSILHRNHNLRLYEHSHSPEDNTRHTTEENTRHSITNTTTTDEPSLIDSKNAIHNKLRLAKAQAEIDRILATPDAPLDTDAELSRVVSVSQTMDTSASANTAAQTVDSLEAQVYQAVQTQDYGTAAQKRAAIDALHMDDALQVLQVNAAYYKAFSANDYETMQDLWLPDESVTCIHPSVPPVIGYRDVMASWKELFENPARCRVEPANVRIVVRGGTTAIVTCEEKVYAKRPFIRGAPRAGKAEHINTLQTTNMFRRVGGGGAGKSPGESEPAKGEEKHRWYLAHHHASWHDKSRVGRLALEQASKVTRKTKQKSSSKEPSGNHPSPPIPEIKMDGILGITDFTEPVLRSDKPSNRGGNRRGNGGDEDIEDFVDRTLKDFMSNNNGGGEQQLPFIQIHRIENTGDSRNQKSDVDSEEWTIESVEEEDDDDDEDEDEDEGSRTQRFTISPTSTTRTVWSPSSSTPSPPNLLDDNSPAGALFGKHQAMQKQRQNCIAVLRELAASGTLSRLHKRVLLSDIITCVARKERSLVEVAYELLYQPMSGDNAADRWEEDFAEQCRAFADELLEEN